MIAKEIPLGEIVPLQIRAYFKDGLRVESIRPPSLTGEAFVLSPFDTDPLQTSESHGGSRYSVLTWNAAVSAIKEGEYGLTIQLETTLLVPQKRNRPSRQLDPFFNDDFFNSFFDGYQKKKVLSPVIRRPS